MLHSTLLTLQIIVSILLVVSILIQQRGTGLSATFGGEGGGFQATKRGAEKVLANATIVLVTLFITLSIGLLFA
ncbi:MAG: preprotein translocase subunit SecG [Patescibacteria group bacterium]|nr:preprotein translocase subunit SecG [Patescibacteria group bacterium]